jgi:bifunctional ADP-heptose synthase (sugar kinase/adenylyltransferase)
MKRMDNFFLHREAKWEEIPWLRPEDFYQLKLKSPVVLINGAFDLLHRTHMRLIFAAAHKAGTLICALDSDDKVMNEKGPTRPIMNFVERATTLNYMPIDYIVPIEDSRDLSQLITITKPDLRVQGLEYKDHISRFPVRKMFVRGGTVHTTEIVERIVGRYGKTQK